MHDRRIKEGSLVGARRRVSEDDLNTGDAKAGEAYFNGAGRCATCHSPTGDLAGVADRFKGLELLQRMLNPGGGRGGQGNPAKATVTLPSGETVSGRLAFRDEFTIALRDTNGWYRSWSTALVKHTVDNPARRALRAAQEVHRRRHAQRAGLRADDAAPGGRAGGRRGTGRPRRERSPPIAPYTGGGLESATLLAPPPDSWPTYHGEYSGKRHSRLSAITPENVNQLTLAWTFNTGLPDSIKATPIVVNGIAYVTTADHMWAVDVRSGRQIWHYTHPKNMGFHIGHRGAAMYKGTVYLTTPDSRLVALDARTGRVKWNVEIADYKKGYWSTMSPLLIRDHLIVGVSGDFDNLPGLLQSFDPETGEQRWKFYSTPPPGTPGSISGGATGGQMWMTGTYDPELNLMYVGTGNPTPVLNGPARPGDNKWTGSILAINPDTGKLAWGFQAVPHDTHDWDAAEVPGPRRRDLQRDAAQAPAAGVAQRLLLRARSHERQEPADLALRGGELDQGHRQGWQPDTRPCQGTGARRPPGGARRGWRHQLSVAELRSRPPGLFIVSARDAYGIWFNKEEHGSIRLGGRRLRCRRPRLHPRARLPDRQGPLGPPDRRRIGRGRAHDHAPASPSPATGAATRWRSARATDRRCGTRRSAASTTPPSRSRSTADSTCSSAAAARSTPGVP